MGEKRSKKSTGYIFIMTVFVMIILLRPIPSHAEGNDKSQGKEKGNSVESGSEIATEESPGGEDRIIELEQGLLPSVQVKVKEEFVEVIPGSEGLVPGRNEEKKPLQERAIFVPVWLGTFSVILFIIFIAGGFLLSLLFGACRVYWLERDRKRFLGFVRLRKRDEKYQVGISEAVLENSRGVEYIIAFPLFFRHFHQYEPITVFLAEERKDCYIEKNLRIHSRLDGIG